MPDQTPDRETALATLLALVREPDETSYLGFDWFVGWGDRWLGHAGSPISWLFNDLNGNGEQVKGYSAILAVFSDPVFRAEHGLLRPDESFIVSTTTATSVVAKARVDAMWDKAPVVEVDVNLTVAPVPPGVLDRPGMLIADAKPSVHVPDLAAALRDLGWPEPDTLDDCDAEWGNDLNSDGLAITAYGRAVSARYDFSGERGDLTFDPDMPFPRLVTAVDRLRWVLGLPEAKEKVTEKDALAPPSASPLVGAVSRLGRPWEPVV